MWIIFDFTLFHLSKKQKWMAPLKFCLFVRRKVFGVEKTLQTLYFSFNKEYF